jgi:sec-independent protein translocase protein TatA
MIGTGEIIVILCIILILFGGKKLPEFAKSLGTGIREFKKACYGEDDHTASIISIEEEKKRKTENISDADE